MKQDWTIVMARPAWDRFWTYTHLMKGEVGAFGYVTADESNRELYVDEIFLVPQEASAAQVDFVSDGLPYALERAATDNRIEDLRFCIHSHGEIGVTFSSTDEDMIKKMGLTTDWFVSVIFNRRLEINGRLDTWVDFPLTGKLQYKDIGLNVIPERMPVEYEAACLDELEALVKEPTPKYRTVPPKSVMSPAAAQQAATGFDSMAWADDDDEIVIPGTIDPDEITMERAEALAREFELSKVNDSEGNTYYYDSLGGDTCIWIEFDKDGKLNKDSLDLSFFSFLLADA